MADGAGDDDIRDGVPLTHLDQPLVEGGVETKRVLVDYLDAVADQMLPHLRGRPLSVIRLLRGQDAFMQKNLPAYAPDWVRTTTVWADRSRRQVRYALCDDRRTLLWFANQRAIEYHVALFRVDVADGAATQLVLDIDPPEGAGFGVVVEVAHAVRRVLQAVGLDGAVKTSGAKGAHVFVPLDGSSPPEDVAAAARALAARTAAEVPDHLRGFPEHLHPLIPPPGSVVEVWSPVATTDAAGWEAIQQMLGEIEAGRQKG